MTFEHRPVLLKEAVDLLNIGGNKEIWVDATLGLGGHSQEILKRITKDSLLIGIDRDTESLKIACEKLAAYPNFKAIHGNFKDTAGLLREQGIDAIDGILYDLGVSSLHFDDASRGFSFSKEAPLDMRMDRTQEPTAADVVNKYSRQDLERIIKEYGEERFFRKITDAIIRNRPVNSTTKLAAIAAGAVRGRQNINPATRLFQALRIEVNGELDAIKSSLETTVPLLKSGGRIAVISFHSLEDRIVKRFFSSESKDCICENKRMACTCGHKKSLTVLTRKPVTPDENETRDNSRSRSARLRAAEKI
jgi:16S rRNA (cytosine1402-N4)-methyltransferase